MNKKFLSLLMLPVMVLSVSLACRFSGGPTPPRPVTTSPEQAQSLNQTLQTAQADPKPGKVTLTVTESQVTSYIMENLQGEYAPLLSNPVVVFQPGQVELYSTIQGEGISANGRVVMKVTVDSQGKPIVNFVEANFGPFPVPAGLLTDLTNSVDRFITNSMGDYQSDYQLESITFTTGKALLVIKHK